MNCRVVTPVNFKNATMKCNELRAEHQDENLAFDGTLKAQTGLLILNRNHRDFNGFAKDFWRVILRSRFFEAKSHPQSKTSVF